MPAIPLDQPALRGLSEDDPPPPRPDGGVLSEVLVQFRDGTWRLCRILGWRQDRERAWWCLLRWGVSGELHEGWFAFDGERVRELDAGGK